MIQYIRCMIIICIDIGSFIAKGKSLNNIVLQTKKNKLPY